MSAKNKLSLQDKQRKYIRTINNLKILFNNQSDPNIREFYRDVAYLLEEYKKFIFNKNLEKGRKSKIEEETKTQIKELYKKYGFNISELANKFGISRNTIRKIVSPTVEDIKKMVEEKRQEQSQSYYLEKDFEELEVNFSPKVTARDVANIPDEDKATEKEKKIIVKLKQMKIL